MKIVLVVALILSASSAFASVTLADKLVGKYTVVDSHCPYDSAVIRSTTINGIKVLTVSVKNQATGAFNLHTFDLDNLWTKIRTTDGFQRIIKQDRIQGSSLIGEQKNCLPGWVGCGEWTTKAEITLVNDDTIEARLSDKETACGYRKVL